MNQQITKDDFQQELDTIRSKEHKWQTGAKARKALRQWCYYIYWDALKRGVIFRSVKCERCGNKQSKGLGGLDGHHASYYEPINVEWLCRMCHRQHHLSTD